MALAVARKLETHDEGRQVQGEVVTVKPEPGETSGDRFVWVLPAPHAIEVAGRQVIREIANMVDEFDGDVICYDADTTRILTIEPDFFMRTFLGLEFRAVDEAVGEPMTTKEARVAPGPYSIASFLFRFGPLVIPENLHHEPAIARLKPRPLIDSPSDVGGGYAIHGIGRDLDVGRHRSRLLQRLEDALGEQGALEGEDWSGATPRTSARRRRVHFYSWSLSEQHLAALIYQAVFESALGLAGRPIDEQDLTEPPSPELCKSWSKRHLPMPKTNLELINTTLDFLAAGTGGFGPRLEVARDSDRTQVVWGSVVSTVLPALCLQAVAFIADDIPVSRCANSTCQRLFARPVGRAKQRQNRSRGFLYCSPACAKSVAMRLYRQRRRSKTVNNV